MTDQVMENNEFQQAAAANQDVQLENEVTEEMGKETAGGQANDAADEQDALVPEVDAAEIEAEDTDNAVVEDYAATEADESPATAEDVSVEENAVENGSEDADNEVIAEFSVEVGQETIEADSDTASDCPAVEEAAEDEETDSGSTDAAENEMAETEESGEAQATDAGEETETAEDASDDKEGTCNDSETTGAADADEDEEEDNEQSEEEFVWDESLPSIESVVEAVLFASDEPVSASRLVNIIELGSTKQVRKAVEVLNEKYKEVGSAFHIEKIAGGYQMMTLSVYNAWLQKMIRTRSESKLTQAAMETLAIVAYKQPIIRADVEAIRGVASGEMIRGLMYKGLVKIVGRAEVIGRPVQYGTSKKFLEVFGLNSLRDLPKVEELKKPG